MCDKDAVAIFSHLSICAIVWSSVPPPQSVLVAAADAIDDITQQGFSRHYYHGAGTCAEAHCPFWSHRFRLLLDPNLLKEPSDRRSSSKGRGCFYIQILESPCYL